MRHADTFPPDSVIRFPVELVDDLEDARLLWFSEERDLGVAKGPYGAPRHDIPDSIARNPAMLPRGQDLENLDVEGPDWNQPILALSCGAR